MIDTARVNARTVAVLRDEGDVPANRIFAFDIVRALVTPHIQRRMTRPGIQRYVKVSAECYLCEYFLSLFVKQFLRLIDIYGLHFIFLYLKTNLNLAVLRIRIRIRIRKDPELFPGSGRTLYKELISFTQCQIYDFFFLSCWRTQPAA